MFEEPITTFYHNTCAVFILCCMPAYVKRQNLINRIDILVFKLYVGTVYIIILYCYLYTCVLVILLILERYYIDRNTIFEKLKAPAEKCFHWGAVNRRFDIGNRLEVEWYYKNSHTLI